MRISVLYLMPLIICLYACEDKHESEKVTLAKNNRLGGTNEFDGVATFYGYVDNRAACEEIAKILNGSPEKFDGMIENQFKCI